MLVFGGGCIYNGYKDDFSKMTKGIVKKIQKGIEQDERKQGTLLTYWPNKDPATHFCTS